MKNKMACCERECRLWIDYKSEYNCTLISIYENGRMTLREVAERLGISFARVKQIETHALEKLKKRCLNKGISF
jgi:hypothetical protein